MYGYVEGPLPIQFFFRRKSDDKGKVIPDLGKVCKQGDDIVSDIWCPDDAVDWISYAVFRHNGMNYRMATICCQAAAILFAYVTNKIWVFRSYNFRPVYLLKEMASFFSCRILTSVFTYVAMIVMVDGMGIKQDMICKIVISAISLVLNYICSKLLFQKERILEIGLCGEMTAEMDAEVRPEKPERVEKTLPEQDSGWREDGAKRTRRKFQ